MKFDEYKEQFKDYFVRYMLNFETRDSNTLLNIGNMEDPFNYKLNILEDYQTKDVTVDLVETYNYLIGLNVNTIKTAINKDDKNRKYLIVEGSKENKSAIVIWRSIKDFNPKKDKDFIKKNILNEQYNEIHINGDNLIENAILIEEQFKRLLNGN